MAPVAGDNIEVSLPLKIGLFAFSILITLVFAEAVVRLADGNALLQFDGFGIDESGLLALSPGVSRKLRTPAGDTYTLHVGPMGLRQVDPSTSPILDNAWLVVGDSQVLGMGVDAEYSFPFYLNKLGVTSVGAGVLGFGTSDSLHRAEALIPSLNPKGVLLVVNQVNDWEDGLTPATERFRVRGGFAVTAKRGDGVGAMLLSSPLGHLHLMSYALQLVFNPNIRKRSDTPPSLTVDKTLTQAMANVILDFKRKHSNIEFVTAFLPADYATSEQRAGKSPFSAKVQNTQVKPWLDTSHRDALTGFLGEEAVVDLLPALRDQPTAFLTLDYHLSPDGHRIVAEALAASLAARSTP